MAKITFRTTTPKKAYILSQPIGVFQGSGKARKKRQLQYREESSSIWKDQQLKEDPKWDSPTTVIFKNSHIVVDDQAYSNLVEMLRKHPYNKANNDTNRNDFYEVDIEHDELYEIEKLKVYDKAISIINNSDEKTIMAMANFLISPQRMYKRVSSNTLELRKRCNSDINFAKDLINFNERGDSDQKLLTTLALDNKVIKIKNGKKIALQNDEVLFSASSGKDVLNEFALFLKNEEEGREIAAMLSKRIKNIE